jgi:hypothetical protein
MKANVSMLIFYQISGTYGFAWKIKQCFLILFFIKHFSKNKRRKIKLFPRKDVVRGDSH